ncbi:MAG: hypothetical protein K0Q96_1754 [Rubrobacteraceae bacterium]|nr:hypothetical protein [Rubrobacteraceae bacterium]
MFGSVGMPELIIGLVVIEEAKKDEEQLEASKSEHDVETKLEEDASVEAEKAEQKHS